MLGTTSMLKVGHYFKVTVEQTEGNLNKGIEKQGKCNLDWVVQSVIKLT